MLTTAISSGSIAGVPAENPGDFSPGETKCKRDIGKIVEAFVFDLLYGGNSSVITAGDYYVDGNGNIQFIIGEEEQSRAAYKYGRDLMIAAMRNFTVTMPNTVRAASTTLTVTSTIGIVEGMDVTGTGFSADTRVVSILSNTTLLLNQNPSTAGTGSAIFTLNFAKYTTIAPNKDTTITVDTSTPQCADIASAIDTLWLTLDTIISTKIVPNKILPTYSNKFGISSAAFGVSNTGTNNIKIDNPEKLGLGTNNWTMEMWIYKTVNATSQYLLDMRSSNPGVRLFLHCISIH